jgi:uncharacterized protein (DUF1330 family)
MAAYIIANVKVTDPEQYKLYGALTPAAIQAAGGEFLARGGAITVLEGNWMPDRMVIIKFAGVAAAKAFYESSLYLEARAKRAGATEFFNMVIVEGI